MKFLVKSMGILFWSTRLSAFEKTWNPQYFFCCEEVAEKRDSFVHIKRSRAWAECVRLAIHNNFEELLS